ncbi:MAG: hypothetical protein CL816_06715 [Coxiellaceae bacterium]|nr:hypothetical protein [Coxiellaceae bacterium]|tara:strand:+ start:1310 stop:2134 length:825 start_codon:yes stop_codon:yes gene_type:complete
MNNDKYINDDEEYHFPGDDDFSEEVHADEEVQSDLVDEELREPTPSMDRSAKVEKVLGKCKEVVLETADRFPILKNKKIMGIVGFMFVAVIVIDFTSSSSHTVNTSALDKSQATQSASVDAPRVTTSQTEQALTSLSEKQASSQQDVNQINNKMNRLNSSVSSLQQSQRQTSQSLRDLNNQIKLLSQQLEQVSKTQQAILHPKTDSAVPQAKPISYHIKAIDSGRAWIVSSKGESKSLVVGDTIDQRYGKVISIDADQGLVYTSSKRVINFESE